MQFLRFVTVYLKIVRKKYQLQFIFAQIDCAASISFRDNLARKTIRVIKFTE